MRDMSMTYDDVAVFVLWCTKIPYKKITKEENTHDYMFCLHLCAFIMMHETMVVRCTYKSQESNPFICSFIFFISYLYVVINLFLDIILLF